MCHMKFCTRKIIFILLFFSFCLSTFAQTKDEIANALRNQKEGKFSQDFLPQNETTQEDKVFALDAKTDIAIGVAVTALAATDLVIQKKFNPKKQTFDGRLLNQNDVPEIDRFLMQPYSKTLDNVGTVFEVAALLTPAVIAVTQPTSEWLTIGTMYAESVLLAYGLKELGKTFIYRARPYTYFEGYPQEKVDSGDWMTSFPSGHTTLAFNAAAFTSFVFSKYNPNSKLKIPVIAGSYALAFGTAALRLASGNHFLTDVITGAVIGTNTGLLIPLIHTFIADKINLNRKGFTAGLTPTGIYCKIDIE